MNNGLSLSLHFGILCAYFISMNMKYLPLLAVIFTIIGSVVNASDALPDNNVVRIVYRSADKVLRSDNPKDRISLVSAIGSSRCLAEVLKDLASNEVRTALKSLGDLGKPQLVVEYSEDVDVVTADLRTLEQIGSPEKSDKVESTLFIDGHVFASVPVEFTERSIYYPYEMKCPIDMLKRVLEFASDQQKKSATAIQLLDNVNRALIVNQMARGGNVDKSAVSNRNAKPQSTEVNSAKLGEQAASSAY